MPCKFCNSTAKYFTKYSYQILYHQLVPNMECCAPNGVLIHGYHSDCIVAIDYLDGVMDVDCTDLIFDEEVIKFIAEHPQISRDKMKEFITRVVGIAALQGHRLRTRGDAYNLLNWCFGEYSNA